MHRNFCRYAYFPSLRSWTSCRGRGMSTTAASDWPKYCANRVRERDYESFLIGHLFPKAFQPGYFALKAFSIELASIQDSVTSPTLGNMRMQFWRDAIKDVDNPPNHPVAVGLSHTMKKHNLPVYHLKRLIDARDEEITSSTYLTVDSLLKHTQSTSCTILYLLLNMMGISSSALDHAASHLGVAQTIVILLRALPFHVGARRMVIPSDITAECGLVQEDVFRLGPQAPHLSDAVFKFATLANDHLVTARAQYTAADKDARTQSFPIFLGMIPVSSFLTRLERENFDVYSKRVQQRDGWLPIRILKGYYTSRL